MSTDITIGTYDTVLASTSIFPRALAAMSPLQAISLYQIVSTSEVVARVLDISGDVVSHTGTPLQITASTSALSTLARLTDTKAIAVYGGGAAAKIVDIAGSELSAGSFYVVAPGSPNYPRVVRLSDTKALLVYNRLSQVRCAVLTIAGTAVSAGAEYLVASPASYPTLAVLSETQVLVTYNSSPLVAEILDIAGDVVTVTNSVATIDANGNGLSPVVGLSGTQAISVYRDSTTLHASATVLNVSASTITPGTPLTNVATDVYAGAIDATALTETNILIVYSDYNNGNQVEARILSDTGVTLGTVKVVGASGDAYPMVAALTNAKAILTNVASGNNFKAIVLETDPPAPPSEPPVPTPLPTLTGIMYGGARMSGTLPMITGVFNGRLHKSNTLEGDLPMMVGTMRGGARLVAVLPAMTGLMTARVSTAGRLVGVLPVMTGVMSGSNSGAGVLEGTLPMMIGAMRGGGQLAGVLPMMTGMMRGSRNTTGVLIGTLPMMTGLMVGTQQITGALVGILPMLVPSGFGRLVGELPMMTGVMSGQFAVEIVYEAYAINLKPGNKAGVHEVTHYTNYPFDGIVRHGNRYYAWGASGLFEITGDTDYNAAAPSTPAAIPWDWMTTVTDFGSSQRKAMRQMTVGGRLGPRASASVSIGKASDFTYRYATAKGERAQNYRIKFGKGLNDRYYSIGLSGAGVGDVDTIDFDVEQLSRK